MDAVCAPMTMRHAPNRMPWAHGHTSPLYLTALLRTVARLPPVLPWRRDAALCRSFFMQGRGRALSVKECALHIVEGGCG